MTVSEHRDAREHRRLRRLLLFSFSNINDMLNKGNIWYVRHYEAWFDEVYVVYLFGNGEKLTRGNTHLIATESGIGWLDFLLAPWRLWYIARRLRATHYLTADIVFSWWTTVLLKTFENARVVLMPVCMPEEIYRSSGRTLSGLPIPVERMLINLSFRVAHRVIMGRNSDAPLEWLMSNPRSAEKLKVVRVTVEEYPPVHFYTAPECSVEDDADTHDSVTRLLYVGRLHPEKHVIDLVEMMGMLRGRELQVELYVVGDGEEWNRMRERSEALGIRESVFMHGFVPSEELPSFYKMADLFVSPLTGTALREAGLMGVPIVAYAMDWVEALLEDGKTGWLAEPGNPASLADKVEEAIRDPEGRIRVADAFRREAHRRWALEHVAQGLEEAFGDLH